MSKKLAYSPKLPTPELAPRQIYSLRSRRGLKLCAAVALLVLLSIWNLDYLKGSIIAGSGQRELVELEQWNEEKISGEEWTVPLESHIMSKCPDARDCLRDLVVPVMVRLSAKINFTLSFIGTPTDPDDGVECMHGPNECLGNIVELCAASIYPDPKIYLGFAMCLSQQYQQIPSRALLSDCAMEHGIEFEKLNDCASRDSGAFGIGLLRDSVRRSKALGVATSCTVRLNDEVRCIRDGGAWKDCDKGYTVNSLTADIERLYKEKNG